MIAFEERERLAFTLHRLAGTFRTIKEVECSTVADAMEGFGDVVTECETPEEFAGVVDTMRLAIAGLLDWMTPDTLVDALAADDDEDEDDMTEERAMGYIADIRQATRSCAALADNADWFNRAGMSVVEEAAEKCRRQISGMLKAMRNAKD